VGKKYNPLTRADFVNIIVYGNQDDEISLDRDASMAFNFMFDHCLLKTHKSISDPAHYTKCIVNKDPGFVNVLTYDYQIDSISPAIQKGIDVIDISFDIMGKTRVSPPDIGAYQYVPK
jgi:hypothetical protein